MTTRPSSRLATMRVSARKAWSCGVGRSYNHLTPHHSVLSNTCVVWVPVRLAKVRVGRDTATGGTAATLTRTLECAVSGK